MEDKHQKIERKPLAMNTMRSNLLSMKLFSDVSLRSLLFVVFMGMASEAPADLSSLLSRPQESDHSPSFAIEDSVFSLSSGDKIRLQWWGNGSNDLTMAVDTRGKILIPEIGEVDAKDKTLREVDKSIRDLIHAHFNPRLISIRVVEVRPATVWLLGVMPNPGPQRIEPGTRLSSVLPLGGLVISELLRSAMSSPPPRREDRAWIPSLRRILVVRNNKDTLFVDLARAFRAGQVSQDPPLYSGDRVIVEQEGSYCALNTGSFNAGMIEFHPGDTIRAVLEAAGVKDIPSSIHTLDQGGIERSQSVDGTMDSTIVLIRFDRTPKTDPRSVVFISGRVQHPGPYFFTPGLTIRELVRLAGGVIGGDDSGVVVGVRRGGVLALPGRRAGIEALPAVAEVSKSYLAYLANIRGQYSHDDLPLQPEDSVIVKTAQRVVWVGGLVMRPGFVPWVKGRTWSHYIEDAGGFSPNAWSSKTQMINPITEQPGAPEGEILPGSAIIVPEKRYIPPEQWISISISIVSLLSSLVTIYLLLKS